MSSYYNIVCVRLSLQIKRLLTYLLIMNHTEEGEMCYVL